MSTSLCKKVLSPRFDISTDYNGVVYEELANFRTNRESRLATGSDMIQVEGGRKGLSD